MMRISKGNYKLPPLEGVRGRNFPEILCQFPPLEGARGRNFLKMYLRNTVADNITIHQLVI